MEVETEKKSIEIALFEAEYRDMIVWKNESVPKTWTRITKPLVVEFEPLSRDEIVQGKLASLKVRENEIRDEFSKKLRVVETERQNLLALTSESTP